MTGVLVEREPWAEASAAGSPCGSSTSVPAAGPTPQPSRSTSTYPSVCCGRNPNEAETLLRDRGLGETICPDCGFRPGEHCWNGCPRA